MDRDIELVSLLLQYNSGVSVKNDLGYGRLDEDVHEALKNVLDDYKEIKEELNYCKENFSEVCKEMLKHINKLERMLDKRSVRFKTWETIEVEKEIDYVL